MKALLDTSGLLPSLVASHSNHEASLAWFAKAEKGSVNLAVSQHALAEAFSVLTGAPPPIRVSPTVAAKLIGGMSMEVVELGLTHYEQAIARLSAAELSGGIIYDMLHLIAAESCGADQLVTSNAKDFERLPMIKSVEIVSL